MHVQQFLFDYKLPIESLGSLLSFISYTLPTGPVLPGALPYILLGDASRIGPQPHFDPPIPMTSSIL